MEIVLILQTDFPNTNISIFTFNKNWKLVPQIILKVKKPNSSRKKINL